MLNTISQIQMVMGQSQTKVGLALFRGAYAKGQKARLFAALVNKSNQLLSIEQITKGKAIHPQCCSGLITVPINLIQGSEARSEDFDRTFNPLKKHDMHRWIGVAMMRLKGGALSAVELIQIGELFVVIDGHHRISVAIALGEKFIDAIVTRWQ